MKKQHEMLDKTTVHFIAHHSCWCWYNIRMMYASYLFHGLVLLLIAKYRTSAETISLVMLYNWTTDMGWLMHVITCFSWFKRNVVETQRVFNLHDVPQEKVKGEQDPPEGWPSQGNMEFKDVFLRYRPVCDRALNGISFRAKAGEKIGIVGRTGAGKSTLFMGLTRIVELEAGRIEIDGVDVSKIDLKTLRDQITMIPQDPTLFTGTLRFNLDPFDQHPDERILELIKKAGLEYMLEGTSKKELEDKKKEEEEERKRKENSQVVDDDDENEEKKGDDKKDEKEKEDKDKDKDKDKDEDEDDGKGLKFKVQEEGKNLSVGERQLICIIRAVLRCNKVVVLDEATANIDVITEKAI